MSQLGRWLYLDWRYYFRGGMWMGLAYSASLLAGFLTSVALTRNLSKEDYGRYGLVFTLMSLVSITALPGLNTAITRSVARGYPRSLLDGTRASVKWALLGSVALLGASAYCGLLRHDPLGQMLLISAVAFPIVYGARAPLTYFVGQKRFGMSAAYWTASELVVAVAVVSVVSVYQSPTLVVLVALSAGSVVNGAFFLKAYTEVRHTVREQDPGLLTYGRRLTGIAVLGTIADYLDRLLISVSLGFAELAVFSIAAVFPDTSKSLARFLDPLVLPRLAGLTEKQVGQRAREKLLPLLVINWLAVIVAVLLTPLVTRLVYPAYGESVRYAQGLFISLAFIVPTIVINSALTSQQRTRQLYHGNLTYAVAQIGSLIVLIPMLGLWGAVLSRLVARFCLAAYYSYAVWHLGRG